MYTFRRIVSLLFATSFVLVLFSSCGIMRRIKGDRFEHTERSGATDPAYETVPTTTEKDVTSGLVSAGSSSQQRMELGGALGGSSVTFPPGSLAVDTNISVSQGADLSIDGTLVELGLENLAPNTNSKAILIESSAATDPAGPFTIALKLDNGATLTQDVTTNYFVVYRVQRYATGEILVGILDPNLMVFENGIVSVSASYWGSYQVFAGKSVPPVGSKPSTNPIKKIDQQVATDNAPIDDKKSASTDGNTSSNSGNTPDNAANTPPNNPPAITLISHTFGTAGALLEPNVALSWTFNVPVNPASVAGTQLLRVADNYPVPVVPYLSTNGTVLNLMVTSGQLNLAAEYRAVLPATFISEAGASLSTATENNFTVRDGSWGPATEFISDDPLLGGFNSHYASTPDGKIMLLLKNSAGLRAAYFDGMTWYIDQISASTSNFIAAFDSTGRPVFAYLDTDIKFLRRNGSNWDVITINPSPLGSIETFTLAASPQGVVVVYREYVSSPSIMSTYLADSATMFSSPDILGSIAGNPNFDQNSLKIDANGVGAFAWQTDGNHVWGVVWRNEMWGTPVDISSTGSIDAGHPPRVLVSQNGDVTFTWSQNNGTMHVYEKTQEANGTWRSNTVLSTAGNRPEGATSKSGKDLIVWRVDAPSSTYVLHYSKRSNGGTWSADAALTTVSPSSVDNLRVVSSEVGHFLVSWHNGSLFRGITIASNDAVGVVQTISENGANGYAPHGFVLDKIGNGFFYYSYYDTKEELGLLRINSGMFANTPFILQDAGDILDYKPLGVSIQSDGRAKGIVAESFSTMNFLDVRTISFE